MATIERGVAPFLVSKDWEPFYPMHSYGVLCEPLGAGGSDGLDHREPQRVRHRRPADVRAARQECSISTFIMGWN